MPDLQRQALADEIWRRVSDRSRMMTTRDVLRILDALRDVTAETLAEGGKVRLAGFGAFSVRDRATRRGVNPRTLERIEIPGCRVVKFAAGSELRKAINA